MASVDPCDSRTNLHRRPTARTCVGQLRAGAGGDGAASAMHR